MRVQHNNYSFMSSHVKTPEELHAIVDSIDAAATNTDKIRLIVEWLHAVTDDQYSIEQPEVPQDG